MLDLNLAPLRYRNILAKDGGPVAALTYYSHDASSRFPALWSAHATLNDLHRPSWVAENKLYSNCDGGGSHRFRSVACFIAISEAIDRWAFYSSCDGPKRGAFGFDIDPSTTGLAAYPGLTSFPARRRAQAEAIERWSIVEWWQGNLRTRRRPDYSNCERVWVIEQPFNDVHVVLVETSLANHSAAFGFSAGRTFAEAHGHARVEMARNMRVLERYFGAINGAVATAATSSNLPNEERRLLHFASQKGIDSFHERIATSCSLRTTTTTPRKLVDSELEGPWSQWATVWRVLFEQSGYDHLNPRNEEFFYF